MNLGVDQKLSRLLVVSQIITMLAVPVVLAVVGFWVQRSLQEQQIKRDYVSLAVSLLLPKKEGEKETSPELRSWATELLNESSPVKLSRAQSQSLKRNGLSLQPGDMIFFNGQKPAIYLGDRQIIRANDDGRVEVQDIDERSTHSPDR
ncbi:C40 family peptidase [Pseudomonas cichorii]|nr:NlpC/P60 family protein [Pseudomonas cichorii]MBX8557015.1 C40 family peptidase [Pseudomonas cichorii]MBX8592870.1 C40 family peptidase [Pseudomonas cichorii]